MSVRCGTWCLIESLSLRISRSVRVVGRPDVFADAVPQAVDLVAGFLCDAVEDEVLLC